jgi:hypothetical protein
MLIFAPSTRHQRSDSSIHNTIRDHIDAAFSGDIAYLFNSAMQVQRLTQNTRPAYIGKNRSAQLAANDDQYRTAVGLACSSQSIATIGPHNISHVNKLYTQPVPPRNHPCPTPSTPHQSFSLPGDICNTILHAAKNKGAGINADSIDLFKALVKQPIPSIKPDLHYIFDLIYQNKLPQPIKRYFTDVYLFCLHKDPTDTTKLRPLGIPTAIRRLIASHVAHTLRDKFASHLLPYNYAVGIPNGSDFVVKAMQLSIEKFIQTPQRTNTLPSRAAVFFDLTNQFNSVSREEFFNVIETSFPEILPLTTLFYQNATTVHHKWDDGTWRTLLMKEGVSQGCPLSPLFASFVVARLLQPIDSLLRERAATRLASGDPGDDGFGGISHLLGFVDDISSCVFLPDLPFLCTTLKTLGASLGCFVNPSKTRILTSCDGSSTLPLLHTVNPTLATSISATIAEFSTRPHPTDKSAPPLPVELTTGFRLLGQPVGSASFATTFFSSCISNVKENISSLTTSITDEQTQLRLFSQCLIQKLPHLLASDILHNLPINDPDPKWEEWNGPLTSDIDDIISTFLTTLTNQPTIPPSAILISQLGLASGGLGLLCPRTRAAPDFVITMTAATRNAQHGFRLHHDLLPFKLHQSLSNLFQTSTNPTSHILQRFQRLLPSIAHIACAPSTPTHDRITHFLTSVSEKSARSRIKTHCNNYLWTELHHEFYNSAPDQLHLLPSILSPQTSYPLISLCRSLPQNRLPPWIFLPALKRKLRLPLFDRTDKPFCPCGRRNDPFGDHIFQCRRINKIGAHNLIRDGFATTLGPLLTTAGYLLPSSTLDIEPQLHLPSDPHARPFDLSFNPDPSSPPLINHACPYTTVGFDVTITSPPPYPSFNPTSPDVTTILTANADKHLQKYEKKKIGRDNKTDPTTGTITVGDTLIGDLLTHNMVLIPLAIDPHGRFGPLLQTFLFDTEPTIPITFTTNKPNATLMYSKITTFPSPKGILKLADHNWKISKTRCFYGHSYSAPTPTIHTLQQIGLTIIKAFAIHIRYARRRFIDHTVPPPNPDPTVPLFNGLSIGT